MFNRDDSTWSQQAYIKEICRKYGISDATFYILLRREGVEVHHKRVYRLYREAGLSA